MGYHRVISYLSKKKKTALPSAAVAEPRISRARGDDLTQTKHDERHAAPRAELQLTVCSSTPYFPRHTPCPNQHVDRLRHNRQ